MTTKKVMIVDNDKDFLSELEETLSASGYEMVAVDDPQVASLMADRIKVDVILLDLKMPGKNGFELAFELGHIPGLQHVPIIAMTGFYKEDYDALFASCGIKKCLKKPFRPLDVIAVIETVLAEQVKPEIAYPLR